LNERGEIVEQHVMPMIADTDLDAKALNDILLVNCPCLAFIEDVHAIFGSSAGATFSFGYICGSIHTLIACCQIPLTKVQPKAWQKVIYQGIPEIRKPSKNGKKGRLDTKAMSAVAAKRLFPTADLRKNEKCKVVHDGIVDALLIAEYARRISK